MCFFSGLSGLKAHILIHTGDKADAYDTCYKCLTYLSGLKSHILIHTGD